MTERTSTIIALIIGALLGLIMGAGISGHITRSWITAGSFQFDCVTYRVERLEP